ncbi:ABC transporter permease [Neorhizobium galegae]|uniref:ABC transporter permease n=1 Tax=Neorhizobium galegae TaxID=399 RepID=UPI000621D937|nr:ABC transporter permease [Neorhizobium galegae]CDZ25585.1 Glutathione transport system permease protein GsiC [Neorhizobium galegae bv. officinalis]KAA9387555.1 ABC transporter permease [Neorhizobium galegae]KAB1110233.1 ABC transporter permease [Neorhizobium galegae]MCM2499194.1 ABC transporter permease [Neorhizobium galegae]MCQ1772698.1 ABC transporter permease [Neorhizobium galegae]
MKAYITKKLLALPLILIGVSLLVFVAIRALPGDPARLMAGPEATQEAVDNMTVRLGLDRSLPAQYASFAYGAVRGDLGVSIKSKLPVVDEIAERLPFTIGLAITAYLIAIGIGVPAGMIAAIYRHGWPDQIVMILAIAGASIANFWLALMAMNTFSVQLGWLPLLGAASWKSFILPSITLAVLPTAVIARMTRSSMIEVMSQDYIRTAYAKGVLPRNIYWSHALRNALLPIITIVGLNFGSLMGGAVVTESVFNWPGIGRFLVDAVRYRDYPVIQGVTLVAVTGVVVINFLAEMLIAFLNPKIRFD